MRRFRWGGVVVAALVLSGCFHQVVNTGRPAGATKVEKPWTSTWIFGLVEAPPIDVRQQCSGGVAIIESKMTFVNGLASMLTLGIWTPLTVSVTCASGGRASLDAGMPTLPLGTDADAVERAARLAHERATPVALVWEPTISPEVTR